MSRSCSFSSLICSRTEWSFSFRVLSASRTALLNSCMNWLLWVRHSLVDLRDNRVEAKGAIAVFQYPALASRTFPCPNFSSSGSGFSSASRRPSSWRCRLIRNWIKYAKGCRKTASNFGTKPRFEPALEMQPAFECFVQASAYPPGSRASICPNLVACRIAKPCAGGVRRRERIIYPKGRRGRRPTESSCPARS